MILKNLVEKYDWGILWETLIRLYPEQENNERNYCNVFLHLKKKQVSCTSRMRLCVEERVEEGDMFWEITGKDGTYNKDSHADQHYCGADKKTWAAQEISWSMSFVPWEKWLASEIDSECLVIHSEEEFVAFCLWEMTWDGFSEEVIQERKGELQRRIKEFESLTTEEKKKRTGSMAQVMTRLFGGKKGRKRQRKKRAKKFLAGQKVR